MALSKYTILIADYIPTDMLLFKILLKQAHCSLLTATNGQHALELARSEHPDLILLDVKMPQLNGFEIASALQKEDTTKSIPILYVADMSDYPIFTPDGKVLLEEDYIGKPFGTKQLVKRILQRLDMK